MPPAKMTDTEIARVQTYLRQTFGNTTIVVEPPAKAGQSAEVTCGGELIGTLHRDVDEGEVSYALHMVILEEDLPETGPAAARRR